MTNEAYLLFPREGDPAMWVHYFNHVPLARRASLYPGRGVDGGDAAATVAAALRRRGLDRAAIGLAGPLPFQPYERLKGLLADARLVPFNHAFNQLFMVKSAEELMAPPGRRARRPGDGSAGARGAPGPHRARPGGDRAGRLPEARRPQRDPLYVHYADGGARRLRAGPVSNPTA